MPKRKKRIKQSRIDTHYSDLLESQGNKCYYCREEFKGRGDKPTAPTVEHLTKVVDGGGYDRENIALACKLCNSNRGEYSVEDWKIVCKQVIWHRNIKRRIAIEDEKERRQQERNNADRAFIEYHGRDRTG